MSHTTNLEAEDENCRLWTGATGRRVSSARRLSISIAAWQDSCKNTANPKPEEQAATRLPARLLTFIESGAPALENAQRVIEQFAKVEPGDERDGQVVHNANDVKLHAPWPERRIACVGGNYAAHLAGMWANRLGKTDVSIEQITEEAKKGRPMGILESARRSRRAQ